MGIRTSDLTTRLPFPLFLQAKNSDVTVFVLEAKSEPVKLVDDSIKDGDKEIPIKRFAMKAYTGGPVNLDQLDFPVFFDLATMKAASSVPVLFKHDPESIVGHGEKVSILPTGVDAIGVISGVGDRAEEVKKTAANGYPWQLSIGLHSPRIIFLKAGETVKVNGRNAVGPCYIAYDGTVREISFVSLGADPNTRATLLAAFPTPGATPMTFEQWLASLKIDPATLDEGAKASLLAAFNAWLATQNQPANGNANAGANPNAVAANATGTNVLNANGATGGVANATGGAINVDEILNQLRTSTVSEFKRIDRIKVLAAQYNDPIDVQTKQKISIQAIEGNWTEEKAELAMLRAARPNPGASAGSGGNSFNGKILQAAMAVAGKSKQVEKRFDDQTLQAAHTRYKGRLGLQEFLLEAAYASGYTGGRNFKSDLREILKAAFSTFEVPQILANNTNQFLLEGFNGVDDAWRQLAKITSVSDFKEQTSYRGVGSFTFEQVAADGLIPHGTMDEMDYGNKVDTFAKMFGITRQDIINDNLGVFSDVPRQLGRGGAIKLNRAFWVEFLNNAAFFSVGNGNLTTGALAIAGLTTLFTAYSKLKGPDGEFLLSSLKSLVVPTELLPLAEQLRTTTTVTNGTAAALPNSNPWANKFQTITSPYLSDPSIPGSSATAYYGLADPNDIPVIEVAFLDGQETPIVETADVDFNRLGIQMRGYFDFGVRKQEYRGGVKSTGV